MNSRRTVIIAGALALALVAFLGNFYYLKGAQDRAYDNAKRVKVYVVKRDIAKGTQGSQAISQDAIKQSEIPQEFYPGKAVTDLNTIRSKVAINDLSAGQVLVDGQFVDESVAQVTFSQRVPAGQVAISVSVDQVHGVAGLLMPGDMVDVLAVKAGDNNKTQVNVLYQNVNIIAIGTKAAPQAGEVTSSSSSKSASTSTGDSGLITFAVPLDVAEHFVVATQQPYSIYLTLVPPDSSPVEPKPGEVNTDNLLSNLPVTPYPKS